MAVCRVPKMVGTMELQLELQWYLLYQLQVMSICFFIQLSIYLEQLCDYLELSIISFVGS